MTLFRFELKKIVNSMFLKIIAVSVILCLGIGYAVVYLNTQSVLERQILQEESIVSGFLGHSESNLDNLAQQAKTKLQGYEEENWLKILEPSIEEYEVFTEQERRLAVSKFLFRFESTLERLKLIRDQEIKPVFPIPPPVNGFATPEDERSFNESMKKYDSSSLYFLYMFFGLFFSVIGAGMFLLLFGDIVTKEGNGKYGSIHLLHTQPIKRYKIPISKFLAISFVTFLFLLGICLFSLLSGIIFDRFGDGDYPILIYGIEDTFSFMKLSTFLMKSIILFVLVLAFSYSLLFFLSYLTKTLVASVGGTLAIMLLGIKMGSQDYLLKLMPYIPFNYFSVHKVLTKEMALNLDNFSVTFQTGIITLVVSILILWVLTFVYLLMRYKTAR